MKICLLVKYKFRFFICLLILVAAFQKSYGQTDSTASIQQPVQQNAGFDVIVKLNGDIVYGLVKEVGPHYISYQRTDIPNGPVYKIPRDEVYVISYRNQVKDYINGREETAPVHQPHHQGGNSGYNYYKSKPMFQNGNVRLGLGFFRSFSKVKNVSNYSSSATFPVVSVAYEVPYKNNLQLGVMLGFGSHKFSDEQFSAYDSTNNNIKLTENIFGLYVYGRYSFANDSSRLQPYLLAGPGITSSNIHSENRISFTNDNSQTILVKSGARTTGLGIIARAGAAYAISSQFKVYIDAGVGLSVLKVGLSFDVR